MTWPRECGGALDLILAAGIITAFRAMCKLWAMPGQAGQIERSSLATVPHIGGGRSAVSVTYDSKQHCACPVHWQRSAVREALEQGGLI